MKTYKHKQTGWVAEIDPLLAEEEIYYKIKHGEYTTWLPARLIENTSDWEEVTEPKEEVIEGWALRYDNVWGKNVYDFVPLGNSIANDRGYDVKIPARLIINPKKESQ